mmetsp:Transcript_26189/g.23051  ORF Transcript_26189/g.23051 Transcript_26189/m.23051 type:complete len:101 (-) Transcript_26189:310-612(-)
MNVLFTSRSPCYNALGFAFVLIVVLSILSWISRDSSWVDRGWSIFPVVYIWIHYYRSKNNPRLLLMSVLATVWGLRLTYNYARKGGYTSKGEDYRWPFLR